MNFHPLIICFQLLRLLPAFHLPEAHLCSRTFSGSPLPLSKVHLPWPGIQRPYPGNPCLSFLSHFPLCPNRQPQLMVLNPAHTWVPSWLCSPWPLCPQHPPLISIHVKLPPLPGSLPQGPHWEEPLLPLNSELCDKPSLVTLNSEDKGTAFSSPQL